MTRNVYDGRHVWLFGEYAFLGVWGKYLAYFEFGIALLETLLGKRHIFSLGDISIGSFR